MHTYDFIMIAVLLLATLFGAWKGLIWQLCSLGSLVVSFFVAVRFSESLAPHLSDEAPWNRFLAMLLIYAGCSLVIWTVCRLIGGVLDRVRLREFDHQMGGILGFAKGVLLCVAITFFAVALLPEPQKESILTSRSGYYIGVAIHSAPEVMPREIHQVIEPYLDGLHHQLHPEHAGEDADGTHQAQPVPASIGGE